MIFNIHIQYVNIYICESLIIIKYKNYMTYISISNKYNDK